MTRSVALSLACIPLLVSATAVAHHETDVTKLVSLDPSKGQLPESLTMDDDGNVFLSFAVAATIGKVTPQLALSSYATLPVPPGGFSTGIKLGPDGCLYSLSAAFTAEPPSAFLWRICGRDEVEQVAAFDPEGFPNDLAFDEQGSAYVTDPFLGRIYRVDVDGNQEVWLDDPRLDGNPAAPALNHFFGVDGIAFDKGEKHLVVGNLDYGEILYIEIKRNGQAGAIRTFARDARLVGCDGLAFDHAGTLYVAVNGQDALVKLDEHAKLTTLVSGHPLDAPASLVFGTQPRNKKTLYIANFAINRALGTEPGTPAPALLSLDTKTKGLPLP